MNSILIAETNKTPAINFNLETGVLEIKGKSIPEDVFEFYNPLLVWLEDYSRKPKESTVLNIKYEFFNINSSKCILDIFKKLEALYLLGNKVMVNWLYEKDDEEMLEAGEDYQCIVNFPFNISEID